MHFEMKVIKPASGKYFAKCALNRKSFKNVGALRYF